MGIFTRKKKVNISEGPWQLYMDSYGDGMRASITFHLPAAQEAVHQGHNACRRVIMYSPEELCHPDGLPMRDEYGLLIDEEQALVAELESGEVDCVKVGHVTYGAMRDVVFQVEDVTGFAKAYARWASAHPNRPSEIRESEGWKFFDEKLRPNAAHWEWIANNQAIMQIVAAGGDLAAPHVLEHLFLGEPAALEAIAHELAAGGLTPALRAGQLIATQELPLDCDEITTWTMRFGEIARAHDAKYDGWGAKVVRR